MAYSEGPECNLMFTKNNLKIIFGFERPRGRKKNEVLGKVYLILSFVRMNLNNYQK